MREFVTRIYLVWLLNINELKRLDFLRQTIRANNVMYVRDSHCYIYDSNDLVAPAFISILCEIPNKHISIKKWSEGVI